METATGCTPSATPSANKTKKRSVNFTMREKVVLLELAFKHRNIIDNTIAGMVGNAQKDAVWSEIEGHFNEVCPNNVKRDKVALKKLYKNLTSWSRKRMKASQCSPKEKDNLVEDSFHRLNNFVNFTLDVDPEAVRGVQTGCSNDQNSMGSDAFQNSTGQVADATRQFAANGHRGFANQDPSSSPSRNTQRRKGNLGARNTVGLLQDLQREQLELVRLKKIALERSLEHDREKFEIETEILRAELKMKEFQLKRMSLSF